MTNNKSYYDFFRELSQVPRPSGKEEKAQEYLLRFAKEYNLDALKEESSGNIIIKKPATSGYEHIAPVILQGHMDMVCEKNPDSTHDFDKDPIELIEEGTIVRANGTTLGADNGIGVAYAMAVLAADNLEHPALEAIFTTEEETTMFGAEHLKAESLTGKYLLNLDSEEEGIFYVSSAGGLDFVGELLPNYVASKADTTMELSVTGLKGGHSGMNIASGRGNANKVLGRVLYELTNQFPNLELISINGGSKPNAITRDAKAIINLPHNDIARYKKRIEKTEKEINHELAPEDSLSLTLIEIPFIHKVFSDTDRDNLLSFLFLALSGVNTMSKTIDDLVESSQNLGVVKTEDEKVTLLISIRSSVDSVATLLGTSNLALAKLCHINAKVTNGYPGWEYAPNSPLRELAIKTYTEFTGQTPKIQAIHAGLECGFFAGILKDVDIISFGPNLHDVHSPAETMELDSAERVYQFLTLLLKRMKSII